MHVALLHGNGACREINVYRKNTHTHTYTHTYTRTHAHTYTRARAHAHIHAHTRTRARTHTHTHTRTHAHIHTRTHTYTHAHTHAHTHTYTHKYAYVLWNFYKICISKVQGTRDVMQPCTDVFGVSPRPLNKRCKLYHSLKSIYFSVFTKQVLRIHGRTKQRETRWQTALHNKEQHNLYYLPNISCTVKYRNSYNVHETGNKYKTSVLEERSQLRDKIVMRGSY